MSQSTPGEFWLQFPRVIGEGQLDDLTPPGWPLWRTTYLCTTSPMTMLSKWPWISRCGDYWQQAELCTDGACRIMMMIVCVSYSVICMCILVLNVWFGVLGLLYWLMTPALVRTHCQKYSLLRVFVCMISCCRAEQLKTVLFMLPPGARHPMSSVSSTDVSFYSHKILITTVSRCI